MVDHLVWFAVILGLALLVTASVRATAALSVRRSSTTVAPLALLGLVAAFVAVALLWALDPVASADAEVLRRLSGDRKPVAASIFALLTTLGDAVPMTTLAAAVAVVLHLRTGAWQVWLLPAVVIAEQVLQVGSFTVLPTLGVADVAPELVSGTAGTYPSGSVARMLAVTGVAALLCDHLGVRGGWATRAVGAVLLVEQAVSRLYLGRHLLVDVVGGLLLGLVLVAGVALLLRWLPAPRTAGAGHVPTRLREQEPA